MPWRPPSVGKSPYDERWKRIRAQVLAGEPLCRLCLSAGKTVPATVADHIVPIAEGGTHAQDNLQPLCKRCHDAIKTPADVAARGRAAAVGLAVVVVDFGAAMQGAGVLDQRAVRRAFAAGMGWQAAHTLSLSALDGVVAAAQRGDLPRLDAVLVTDDARWGIATATRLGIDATVQALSEAPGAAASGAEAAWLRERWGSERDARQPPSQGPQAACATVPT